MDRQLIRMNESLESVKTISECIKRCGRWNRRSRYLQNLLITNMESMIHYFKLVSEGYTFGCSETYLRQEAPKGELGCYVLSGIIKPSRMAIRSPDYQNLQALNVISSCHQVADLIATLGSADFVLGSLERSTPVVKPLLYIFFPAVYKGAGATNRKKIIRNCQFRSLGNFGHKVVSLIAQL